MSHCLGHLSYICSLAFVWKAPGRNQDLSKKYLIPESTSVPRWRIRTYRQKPGFAEQSHWHIHLQSSRVYHSDLGAQNPYTIHAEQLSAQAWDTTRNSSCPGHTKLLRTGVQLQPQLEEHEAFFLLGETSPPALRIHYPVVN